MTKEEAAKFLKVSEKTLQRWTKQGFFNPIQLAKAAGGRLVYDDDELTRFKEQRESVPMLPVRVGGGNVQPRPGQETALDMSSVQTSVQTLMPAVLQFVQASERITAAAETIALALEKEDRILTLKEAAVESGLSPDRLKRAAKLSELRATKNSWGRGWRVKLSDLRGYVRKL